MSSNMNRVVVLVDMDCFYCQVEEKLNSDLVGKPLAVVQYKAWKGGGIIAVNYPARDRGVTRYMRGDEAKKICPEIELVKVPNVRGKADLTKYREAGKRVAEVLGTFTSLLQRASVDEAYLDITEAVNQRLQYGKDKLTVNQLKNTHIVGCETEDFLYNIYNNEIGSENNIKLAVGGAIVEDIRDAVFEKTGYRCSAGIAHNKTLAKLACGLHKPNQQTILPQDGVPELYETLPIKKIKNLGGKFGESLTQKLKVTYMAELSKFSKQDLMKQYDDKTASWLYNISRGIDTEMVTVRLISKSIGCCKKFPGQTALKTLEEVTHWMSELATEISERLEQDLGENNRRAKQIIISFAQPVGRKDVHSSRTQVLNSYNTKKITDDCLENLKKFTQKPDGSFCLKFLGLSAGRFEDCKNLNSISTFFKPTSSEIDECQQGNIVHETDKNSETKFKQHDRNNCNRNTNKDNGITKFFNNMKMDNKTEKSSNSIKVLSEVTVHKSEINESEINYMNTEHIFNTSYQNVKPENKLESLCNTTEAICELNVDDIENDSDNSLNIDETLQNFAKIKKLETDCFLETTTEADYSEILKTKEEFPKVASNFQSAVHFGDTTNSLNIDETLQNFAKIKKLETDCFLETTTEADYSEILKTKEEFPKVASNFQSAVHFGDTTNSFFMKYVQNMNTNPDLVDSEYTNEMPTCSYAASNFNDSDVETDHDDNLDEEKALSTNFWIRECLKCGKKIAEDEYISHMDFHMAMNLMEDEKKLFREQPQAQKQKLSKTPVKSTKSKGVKRKSHTLTGNHSISSYFLNKENLNVVNGVSCPECKKLFSEEELPAHLDFHVAKRLHLELNSVQIVKTNDSQIGDNKKQKSSSNINSIVKFLKPVQN